MTEYDGLTFAPVLVVDLNAVFGRENHVHSPSLEQSRWL
jgi:hypothetical protein